MGVPMRRTTVSIYALGGFYSALGGVIYALYTSSGYPLAGTGNELTAIASVVLGGTVLTGGVGMVAGTLFGGMILRLDRDAHQLQRLAERSLDHDQRRRSPVPVHRDAAIAPLILQTARASPEVCSKSMAPVSKHLAPVAQRPRAAVATLGGRAGSAPRPPRPAVRAQYPHLARRQTWPRDRRRNLSARVAVAQCGRNVRAFSVSRTALREAYSVLTAKAMIVARPKIGTRVRPKADWNMLDPEVLSWHLQSTPTENFVAELFVLRQMVEPEAAALAAKARSRRHDRPDRRGLWPHGPIQGRRGRFDRRRSRFPHGDPRGDRKSLSHRARRPHSHLARMHLRAQLGGRLAHPGRPLASAPGYIWRPFGTARRNSPRAA